MGRNLSSEEAEAIEAHIVRQLSPKVEASDPDHSGQNGNLSGTPNDESRQYFAGAINPLAKFFRRAGPISLVDPSP